MPTFKRCPKEVNKLANEILNEFETHKPLRDCKAIVDLVFAYPDYDEATGEPLNDALSKNGCKALGIARKLPPKDRAMGRGDAEIALDGHWWERASDAEQKALLDHELHHLMPKIDKRGLVLDDSNRPVIVLRPHDFEVGWFHIIAARHGDASQERQQAKALVDKAGQYYWPGLQLTNGKK
jgi:hypothetical protein